MAERDRCTKKKKKVNAFDHVDMHKSFPLLIRINSYFDYVHYSSILLFFFKKKSSYTRKKYILANFN